MDNKGVLSTTSSLVPLPIGLAPIIDGDPPGVKALHARVRVLCGAAIKQLVTYIMLLLE